MKKWIIGIGVFLVIAAIIGAMSDQDNTNAIDERAPITPSESTVEESPVEESSSTDSFSQPVEQIKEEKEVTMEKFKQLENGMSYEEVVEIVGFEGTELSSTELGGIKTIMYSWQNDDGSNMNAMFQNNKLNTKAQFGLR